MTPNVGGSDSHHIRCLETAYDHCTSVLHLFTTNRCASHHFSVRPAARYPKMIIAMNALKRDYEIESHAAQMERLRSLLSKSVCLDLPFDRPWFEYNATRLIQLSSCSRCSLCYCTARSASVNLQTMTAELDLL